MSSTGAESVCKAREAEVPGQEGYAREWFSDFVGVNGASTTSLPSLRMYVQICVSSRRRSSGQY